MSREMLTVGSTMRIPLLYQGEYSQWVERKATVLYKYETFKATEGELLLDTYIRYLQVINDLKKCGYSEDNLINDLKKCGYSGDNCELNFKFLNNLQPKWKQVKCYNCKKEGHFAKDCNKEKVTDYEYYKTKMLLGKKDKDEQVLLAEDQAWMESSSDSDQEINANMVFMAQIEKVLSDSEASLSKGIGFENPSYFEKAKDLRPTLYDEKQTSLLKPYVPNVILEKIKIDLEDEVVILLEKEKVNMETIESLKSKSFESSENVSSESENQSENDCLVVEKECDKEDNSKVIALGIFKLNVSQCVSPISMMNDLLDDNNFFIFDDVNVRISLVSKMPFRKNPRDSMHVRSKSNSNKSLPRTVHKWLPKLQPLAEPVAKWFPRVQHCPDCPDLSLDHRLGMFKAYD
nr:hypothetical protein [Tanacetum cinerariifolium]